MHLKIEIHYNKWYIYICNYLYNICIFRYMDLQLCIPPQIFTKKIPRSIFITKRQRRVSNHPRSCLQRFPWMFQWKMPVPRTELAKKVVKKRMIASQLCVFWAHLRFSLLLVSSFEFSGILHVTQFVVPGHILLPWTHLSLRDLTAENVTH